MVGAGVVGTGVVGAGVVGAGVGRVTWGTEQPSGSRSDTKRTYFQEFHRQTTMDRKTLLARLMVKIGNIPALNIFRPVSSTDTYMVYLYL